MDINEYFFTGRAVDVGETTTIDENGFEKGIRTVTVEAANGQEVKIKQPVNVYNESDNVVVEEGTKLVLVRTEIEGEAAQYDIQEPYRLDGLFILFIIFVLMVIKVTGKKGLFAFLGLVVSLLILVKWLVPNILAGYNPVMICFFAALGIAIATFYLSHGFKKSTSIALISTLATLVIAFIVSLITVHFLQLFGSGTEEAISLNFSGENTIDLRGLFLGAVVIGTLGVLDDVTITQVATVHEIHDANNKLGIGELYRKGLEVGKDHIASIINTLFLAYVGASFPLFILLVSMPRPLWVNINSEGIAEEIVRTLVGSMTLVIAIPIATMLAAHFYASRQKRHNKT